jgi:hypothetical protein
MAIRASKVLDGENKPWSHFMMILFGGMLIGSKSVEKVLVDGLGRGGYQSTGEERMAQRS